MVELDRVDDWDRRLARVTERHMRLPGEWGVSDCLMTWGDAVIAVTGEDLLAPWRGRYRTERGAARHMRREGCETVEDVLRDFFGLPPVGRLLAQRGDAVTCLRGGLICVGYICEYGAAFKTDTGLDFVAQTEVRAAFMVGRR